MACEPTGTDVVFRDAFLLLSVAVPSGVDPA
jgi:hypothetical protein